MAMKQEPRHSLYSKSLQVSGQRKPHQQHASFSNPPVFNAKQEDWPMLGSHEHSGIQEKSGHPAEHPDLNPKIKKLNTKSVSQDSKWLSKNHQHRWSSAVKQPSASSSESHGQRPPLAQKQHLPNTRRNSHQQNHEKKKPHPSAKFEVYSDDELKKLTQLETYKVIDNVFCKQQKFLNTLNSQSSRHTFEVIIPILAKISSGLTSNEKAATILSQIFSKQCSFFQSNLTFHIRKIGIDNISDLEVQLSHICDLFIALLKKIPDTTWNSLSIEELHVAIKFNELQGEVLQKMKELHDLHEEINKSRQHLAATSQTQTDDPRVWDNCEFKQIEILPVWEEICNPEPPTQLRPNIVEGEYKDWMHYFDVQFRLLREDFVSPLRKGICGYKQGKVGKQLQNVKVYRDVKITKAIFTRAGLCFRVHFNTDRFRHYNWEHSKRLIFGSLLCFLPVLTEPDENAKPNKAPNHEVVDWKHMIFATVSNRDPEKLKEGNIEVHFQNGPAILFYTKGKGTGCYFVMVESAAYFEASCHILRRLQSASMDDMPFTKYLIQNDCKNINCPSYLRKECTYDIQFIVKSDLVKKCSGAFTQVPMSSLDDSKWPTADMTELDESQLEAIKKALTQEIAVIQGPPGTGKTYIGLKIMQALIKNSQVWNPEQMVAQKVLSPKKLHAPKSPILVMCYTNHALDQFLEGILDMYQEEEEEEKLRLVRIGGRSRSEKIKECNINLIKRKMKNIPSKEFQELKETDDIVSKEGSYCDNEVQTYKEPQDFVSIRQLRSADAIDDNHYRSLISTATNKDEERKSLELWLGLYDLEEVIPTNTMVLISDNEDDISSEEQSDECSDGESFHNGATSLKSNHTKTELDFHQPVSEQDDETIIVPSAAKIAEDSRMLDETDDMYQQIKSCAPSVSQTHNNKKDSKINYRRVFLPVQHKGYEKLVKHIMKQSEMGEQEAKRCKNVHQKKLNDRFRLYKYWHSRYKKYTFRQLQKQCQRYNERCNLAQDLHQQADRHVLQTADVIGITTTGAAKYQKTIHSVKPKIVIVEEAAEVFESHIVSALNSETQHLILIGDHKQLRPNPNEYDLVKRYKLDISLFERLVMNDFPHVTLKIQHRMRPEIADLVRHHIYDELHDHASVQEYPKVSCVEKNLFLINHNKPEKEDELSHSNEHEANFLVALCQFLLSQGYSRSEITILVAYTGQLLLIKKKMPRSKFEGVRLITVDDYQGEENVIILLSLVRSNKEGSIGFLSRENRVCVALSRAKHGFYCIANFDMLRKTSDLWREIVFDMEKREFIGEGLSIHCCHHPQQLFQVKSAADFEHYFPDEKCQQRCGIRLDCGHTCRSKCHTHDQEFNNLCTAPCRRPCPKGHPCTRLCYEQCMCTTPVIKFLPDCGHPQEMKCHEDPRHTVCRFMCEKVIPMCGHIQQVQCYKNPVHVHCKELCTKDMPSCGHKQEMMCHKDPAKVKCKHKCEKSCRWGHQTCQLECYQNCSPCTMKCVVKIEQCGHELEIPCHQRYKNHKCTKPCENHCKRGHPCVLACYEHSSSQMIRSCKPCNVKVQKELDCGHKLYVACSGYDLPLKCEEKCLKVRKCGHPCLLECGVPCESGKCYVMVDKLLDCGHVVNTVCMDELVKCNHPCERKVLDCGHKCKCYCGDPCKCMKSVKKSLLCGHRVKVLCSKRSEPVTCDNLCLKQMPCGHKCNELCHDQEPCPDVCSEKVKGKLKCGHEREYACSEREEALAKACKEPCNRYLECSHKCPLRCYQACHTAKCNQMSSIKLPCDHQREIICHLKSGHVSVSMLKCEKPCENKLPCGHECKNRCGSPCTAQCEEYVQVTCPEGHKFYVKCFEKSNFKCEHKCRKKLSCGHDCQKRCFEACTDMCKERVKKEYECGHYHFLPCSTPPVEARPCDITCRAPLACGHLCKAKCSECRSSRVHGSCKFSVQQRHFSCGIVIRKQCLGLNDYHDLRSTPSPSLIHCMHSELTFSCGKESQKCQKPCSWTCSHHKCSKLCYEICDREPCNRKCPHEMECGHSCVGLCGEQCIELCPTCDPEGFSSSLILSQNYSSGQSYIQLPCGHISTVQDMDKEVSSSNQICPPVCPECSELLSCSYRYGNCVKEAFEDIKNVKIQIKRLIAMSKLSCKEKLEFRQKIVSFCPSDSELVKFFHHFSLSEDVSRAKAFICMLLFQICTFASRDMNNFETYHPMLLQLDKILTKKGSEKLSYQMIQDLISETFRLCIISKITEYHTYTTRRYRKEKTFFEISHDVQYRMTPEEFTAYAQQLDKELVQYQNYLGSAEQLVQIIKAFQPCIMNGHWEKCSRGGHYFCVPLCEIGAIEMTCPECNGGDLFGCIRIKKTTITKSYKAMDISEERDAILASISGASSYQATPITKQTPSSHDRHNSKPQNDKQDMHHEHKGGASSLQTAQSTKQAPPSSGKHKSKPQSVKQDVHHGHKSIHFRKRKKR